MSSGVSEQQAEVAWQRLMFALKGADVPPLIVTIGLGDGALLSALDARAPGRRVLALEPDAATWQRVRAIPTVDIWQRSGRLLYLSGPSYAGAEEAWRLFPASADAFKLIVHPSLAGVPHANSATAVVRKIVYGVKANAEARRKLAPRYLTNVLHNVPGLARERNITALTDAFRGLPAIIAAAGPSLDNVIGDLKRLSHRAVLFSADTALRPLLAAGIAPQFVVAVDPSPANARHFHSLPPCPDTWMIAESALDPTAVAPFEGRTYWFRVSNHHPWPWLKSTGLDVGQVAVWGSVLTAVFQVASLAGCDPIIVVGADLAFTGGQPYCRGTTYELDWAGECATGTPLAEIWQAQTTRRSARTVSDIHGRPVVSTESMLSFRDWVVARAQKSGRRVINATGGGILQGEGIEQMKLSHALGAPLEVQAVQAIVGPLPEAIPVIADRVREMCLAVQNGPATASPLKEWKEFSGEGFDAAAVSAALDASVARLEGRAGCVTPPLVNAWSRAEDSPLVLSILPGMSQSLARFQALVGNATNLGDGTATAEPRDPVDSLRTALTVLVEICSTAATRPDIVARVEIAGRDQVVSRAYHWPEDMRWAILVFESLLMRAWTGPFAAFTKRQFGEPLHPACLAADLPLPLAARACTTLTQQWVRCAATLTADADLRLRDELSRRGFWLHDEDRVRLLTGRVTLGSESASVGGETRPSEEEMFIRPVVLSDERLHHAIITYAVADEIVCVARHARESVVVTRDGPVRTHHRWPRSITFELPLGDTGAVAWSNGLGESPVKPGYVMYRHCAEAEPIVSELPVRPSNGVWVGERLFWNCLPSGVGSWRGVASWTPSGGVRRELSGVLFYNVTSTGDGIVIEPLDLDESDKPTRRRLTEGWLRSGNGQWCSIELGPLGSSIPRAVWPDGRAATAYPEANSVAIGSGAPSAVLACHYPSRIAWLGDALLVTTGQRDLLRFDGLGRL